MRIENGSTPTILFFLVDETDNKSPLTGASPTVTLSKAGAAFGAATNSPAEIANGFYSIALTAGETDTDGELAILATATGANDWRDIHQVETTPATVDINMTTAIANKIADHVWRRTLANIRASSDGDSVIFRSPLGALAKIINRVALSGTTLTVYQEDDSTPAGTQTVTTNESAAPVTEVDTN